MFNGFSAIEMLIKIASAKLPAFSRLADDAQKEFTALKSRPTKRSPDSLKAAAHPASSRVRKTKVIRPAKSG